MMRDFARKTTDDIVDANYDTDKRSKIVEKVKQFFPTLGQVDEQVSEESCSKRDPNPGAPSDVHFTMP